MQWNNHLWHPYTQEKTAHPPLSIVSAKGVRLKLADNRELIDGISSWWVMCHGHSHPYIIEKVKAQLDILPHIMFAGFVHQPAYLLAEKLIKILPKNLNKIFYSDSGSIAVEIALKIARQYWFNIDRVNKTKFISFKAGYHGDSLGAMSVSDNDYHQKFASYTDRYLVDIPTSKDSLTIFENIVKQAKDEIAGLIIEPLLQAAGGMRFHSASIVKAIYDICKKYEILFIADEIATGFGRTGSMFACDQSNITPDIICLGKALTGGVLTLAATVVTKEVYNAFYSDEQEKTFMHGPTYMANPLACSAAIASIELFEIEPRSLQVNNIENQLKSELARFSNLPNIIDVRIMGAIGVVEFIPGSFDIQLLRQKFIDKNILLRPFSNVIYIMPPFVISENDLAYLCEMIYQILK